jgi:hypothetical protein
MTPSAVLANPAGLCLCEEASELPVRDDGVPREDVERELIARFVTQLWQRAPTRGHFQQLVLSVPVAVCCPS